MSSHAWSPSRHDSILCSLVSAARLRSSPWDPPSRPNCERRCTKPFPVGSFARLSEVELFSFFFLLGAVRRQNAWDNACICTSCGLHGSLLEPHFSTLIRLVATTLHQSIVAAEHTREWRLGWPQGLTVTGSSCGCFSARPLAATVGEGFMVGR